MKIHHIGIIVRNIQEHFKKHIKVILPHVSLGETTTDPLQQVKVAFIPIDGGQFELVEPLSESSPVMALLSSNTSGFHHVCFEVQNLDEKITQLKSQGVIIVSPPKPAAAFDGRKIAFVLTRDKLLWELLECP
ncbi:lactoylglutathione lyase [Methylophilaceae bacterium]|nr:lactoylglutathione lyase [Methylophilaceae bacterium]